MLSEMDIEIDRYMHDCAAKGLSVKTMRSYEQSLKLFAKWLKETFEIDSPTQVKNEHLKSYMNSLSERGKYEYTANDTGVLHPKS